MGTFIGMQGRLPISMPMPLSIAALESQELIC
jgi:hypothetical protein